MSRAVIFDMDGLMFDSEALGLKIAEQVMDDYPYDFDYELNKRIIGTNVKNVQREYMKLYGMEFPFEEFMERKHRLLHEHYEQNDIPKKRGLLELLAFLKQHDFKIGMASSTYREKGTYMLKKAGIYEYFDARVFGDEVIESKPDPEIFEKTAAKLGVLPEQAIVLEDSENGLIAAHRAGIPAIFVKDLVQPSEAVLSATVFSAKSLLDVIDYIEKTI
ncbi:MAG: HAD family hydrolase [Bacillus sp. (in: firmicutes)]